MFTLVRFDNGSQGIYPSSKIKSRNGSKCIVRHKGCNYEAECIASDDSETALELEKISRNNEKSTEGIMLRTDTVSSQSDVAIVQNDLTVRLSDISGLPDIENYSFGSELVDISNTVLFDITFDNTSNHKVLSFNELENVGGDMNDEHSAVEETVSIIDNITNGNIYDSLQDQECNQSNEREASDDDEGDPTYQPSEGEISECNEEYSQDCDKDRENTSVDESLMKSNRFSDSLNEPNTSRCDDSNMYVGESRGKKGDKKTNFCLYCMTKQQKIARHLENKHKEEEEVKKFIHLPKGNQERKNIISNIRKRGNFLFNTASRYNDGELIVSRRPRKHLGRSAVDFKACANCKAFFSKNTLRIHFRQCSGEISSSKRITQILSRKVTSRVHSKASSLVKKDLIPVLREDEITRLIRYDELVIIYANKMTEKYRNPRHFDMIRQRMRLIGRFLLILKRIDKEITDLASIFDPKFSDNTLKAINEAARFNAITCNYEAPTVAFNLGSLLKQIGNFFITECVKSHQEIKRKNAKNFLKLLTQEINISVNRNVTESQVQMQRRKKIVLPSIEDIRLLHSHISRIRKQSLDDIRKTFSSKTWIQLAEATLMSIQLFNRRRAGEVERILIEDFNCYQGIDEETDKDLFKSLNDVSKQIAKKYIRFTIRGKLNRTVPVLLDTDLLECVKSILSYREKAGVPVKNPYVFGIKGRLNREFKYLRACNLMRRFSIECGAEYPDRLRGTELRKHIATTCITLNLEEQEVSDLANFMGHAEKIHKDIYRQPVVSRDILRMSRLLEVAQGAASGTDSDSDGKAVEINGNIRPSQPRINPTELQIRKKIRKRKTSSEENDSTDDEFLRTDTRTKLYSKTDASTPKQKKRSTSPYGTVKRSRWTEAEKNIIFQEFATNLQNRTLPSLQQIQQVIRRNPLIQERTSPQVKTWIHNQFKK